MGAILAGPRHERRPKAVTHEVYTAPTVAAAEARFAEFEQAWGDRYPAIIRLWRNAWEQFTPFLAFPPAIRKIVYTTNAIESLNSRFPHPVAQVRRIAAVDQQNVGISDPGHPALRADCGQRRQLEGELGPVANAEPAGLQNRGL
jgi:mutator family transposase